MSKVIDERVVEMRFDNKDFESNVQTSLKTIDKLKESLNFDESTKSVEKFQDSLKHFSLDDIGNAIEGLSDKFNWSNIFKMDLLNNVTETLYSTITGVFNRIKNELHLEDVDPVSNMIGGWNKYAEKTQSVATIMAATGESMEYVNEQMDRLLYFTDETSYSFTDMTSNIGKFTANGIGLEDASTAMQGIATWAARSGQNAQTASRVMYNLAQAIGMGALKLQDWKSVELANMGTKEFKEMAIQAGLANKTLTRNAKGVAVLADGTENTLKETEVTVENFRETLQKGWLDNNVLMDTLEEYGKASELISDINESTGMYASNIIELAEKTRDGKMSLKEFGTALGYSEDEIDDNKYAILELKQAFELLGSEEYAFSLETYKAAQEARTFGDAMASVADAVSSKWMTTFELLFGGYETAKVLWTDLATNLIDIFSAAGDARNEVLEEANLSGWDKFTSKLEDANLSMLDLESAVRRIMGTGALRELEKEAGSFEEALKSGKISADVLNQAIDNLPSTFTRVRDVTDGVISNYEEMTEWSWELRKGMYGFDSHDDQVKRLMEAKDITKEYAEQVVSLSERHHELGRALTEEEAAEWLTYTELTQRLEETVELTDEEKKALKELTEELDKKGAQESFVNGLMNAGHIALEVFTQVREAVNGMFPPATAEQIRKIAAAFERTTSSILEFITKTGAVRNIVTALILPFRILADVAGAVVKIIAPLGKLLLAAFTPIIGIVSDFGAWLIATREQTKELEPFANIINKVAEALSVLIGYVAEVAKYVGDFVKAKLIEKFSAPFQKLVETINQFKNSKLKGLDDFIKSIKNANAEETANKIIDKLKDLKKTAHEILDPIANVFRTIKAHFEYLERVKRFSGLTTLQNLFETIKWVATNALNQIKIKLEELGVDTEKLSARFSKVSSFFTTLYNAILAFVQPIVNAFKTIREHFDYLERVKEFTGFTTLQNVVETIRWTAVSAFKAIRDNLKDLGIDLTPVIDRVREAINAVREFITGITHGGEGETIFTRIKNSITQGTGALQEFLSGLGITLPKVLTGGGIALAGAGIIGFIKKLKELKSAKSGDIIGNVVNSLNPFSDVIEKLKTATSSFNITSFAVGIGLLAAALIALSFVPAEKLVTSLGVIGTALVEFLGTIAATNKIMGDKGSFRLVGMGLGMIAVAGSLLLFAKAIEKFKDIEFESGSQMQNTFDILIAAVVSMGSLAKAAGKFNFKLSNGLGLMAAAGSFYLFGKVLESYTKLKVKKSDTNKVLGALVSAIVTFGIIAGVAGGFKFKLSNGLGLIALTGSLLLFGRAVEKLGKLDKEVLRRGGESVAALGLVVSGIVALISYSTKGSGIRTALSQFITLTAVTVAVIAFAAVAAGLGALPQDMLQKGWDSVFALSMLIVALTAMVSGIGKMTGLRGAVAGVTMLIGLAVAIAAFGAVVAALGLLSPVMLAGTGVLGLMIIELWAIFAIINKLITPNVKGALAGVAAIGLFGLSLIPMVYVLKELGSLDYQATVDGLRLLGNLLGAFAILLGVSVGVGLLASAAGPILLIGMGVVAGILLLFVGAIAILVHELEKLAALDANAAREGLQCVREELEILTDLAHKFMDDEGLFGASMEAALVCWSFGIGLNKLANDTRILGLANAAQASEALKVVQEELDLMFNLGEYLSQNEGSFSKAINASAVAFSFGIGLHGLANDTRILGLANAENAKEAIEPMTALISMMITLANTIGSDPTMFAKSLTVAGEMAAFGVALLPLVGAEFIAGLADSENVTTNMQQLMNMVDAMVQLAEKISADASLYFSAKAAAEAIKDFGYALMPLLAAEFLGGFVSVEATDTTLSGAKKVIDWLVEVAGKFQGEDSISEGAGSAVNRLSGFATALLKLDIANFASQFVNSDMALAGLEPVKEIIDMLVGMADNFDGEESKVMAAAKGVDACSTFADALKKIVKAENRIAKTDATAALEGITPVQSIVTMLIDTAREFATVEGMAQGATTASTAIEGFATNLNSVATIISQGKFSSVDPTSVTQVMDSIIDGITRLSAIDTQISNVSTALAGVGDIFDSLSTLGTKGGIFGSRSVSTTGISKAFEAIGQSLADLGQTAVQEDVGNRIMNSIITPITENYSVATEAILNLGTAMSDTLLSFEDAFYVDGNNIAVGFINGIYSRVQDAYDAGYQLASDAKRGTEDAGKINSPSKVFEELGSYIGEGFVQGIESKYSEVTQAAASMSNQAAMVVEAFNEKVKQLLTDNAEEFHITPVIDTNKLYQIDSLLAGIQSSQNYGSYQVSNRTIDSSVKSRSVVPELRSLQEYVAKLDSHIENMQIVLDTGVLVGATSAKMDSQFGIMSMRRGRGN